MHFSCDEEGKVAPPRVLTSDNYRNCALKKRVERILFEMLMKLSTEHEVRSLFSFNFRADYRPFTLLRHPSLCNETHSASSTSSRLYLRLHVAKLRLSNVLCTFREPTIPEKSRTTHLDLTKTPQAASHKIARVNMRVIK
jgi:hypothetical protein